MRIDERPSYNILNNFFSHFHLVLIQIRGVLEQLSMVFRIFCNFLFESCNSSFFRNKTILEYFDVIQEEIMQIGKAKHLEDLGKTMNVDSRCLERHYKGKSYVPKSQDNLYGKKPPKEEETCLYAQENTLMHLEHDPCT